MSRPRLEEKTPARRLPDGNRRTPDVFHVGYPRTGTTYLQKGIWSQLPDCIYRTRSRVGEIYRAASDADLDALFRDVPPDDVGQRIYLESEEEFSGDLFRDYLDMPAKLARINPSAQIILCLRSQATIIPSLYYLFIKKGNTLSYPEYASLLAENRKFDYLPLIEAYWKAFGRDNVLVLLFEDLRRDATSFVKQVLTFMGIDEVPTLDDDPQLRNVSLSPLHIRTMRWLNAVSGTVSPTRYMAPDERQRVIQGLHRRTRLASIPFFVANLARRVVPEGWGALPTAETAALIERTYAENNIRLFDLLNMDIDAYGYPGAGHAD